jgi:hypothetical protein
MSEQKRTIRFEDLGEPVQKLLKKIKGGVTEEEMALFEFVSVKDMAKIFSEMSSERHAEEIWEDLKNALLARREKAERKRRELEQRQTELDAEANAEEAARLAEEEAARQEAEERRRRKEERKRRKEEEAAAQEEQDRLEAEAEAERLAQEEEDRKQAEKKRRREAKRRALEEEQERLREEQEREKKKKSKNSKKEWDEYVKAHPLEFANVEQQIEQVRVERETKPPPKADDELLKRTYTPKCPNCQARFSKPPKGWDCPMCDRRYRQKIKTWQPDEDVSNCPICNVGVGRFSRHHCRNCGRVVCGKCSEGKAAIPAFGFDDPVKVCTQCTGSIHQGNVAQEPTQLPAEGGAAPAATSPPKK